MLKRAGKFYADSGADISVIKIGELAPGYPYDAQKIVKVQGVTDGTAYTLGQAEVQLSGLLCNVQVVANEFPIENSGIIGWDIIDTHSGCVDAASKSLRLGEVNLPFESVEKVTIPARVKMTISAHVRNDDVKVGWVPLTDLHPDLLFGNFAAENIDGRVYASCYNIGDTEISIATPTVELLEGETLIDNSIFQADEDGSAVNVANFSANLRRLISSENGHENYQEIRSLNEKLQADAKARCARVDKIMQLADLEGCNSEEREFIRKIVDEFAGVFGLEGEPLPATHLLQHKIVLKSNKQIRNHRFRFPPAIKESMLKELAKLREQNIVVPSSSNYSSSLWIVPKKPDAQGNKRFRLVTDFRALNEETEGSCHPLPFTSDILEHLALANYITVMDLKQGYHQIEMHPDSAHLTAFYAPDGNHGNQLLQFNRMAMGLKEATITFTRAMSLAMAGLQGDEVEIYLDDLMVFGETLEEHNERLRRVLGRLLAANMTVEPKKCQFLKKEAQVLGHIVGGGLIKTDPVKTHAMANYPTPTDPKKMKQAMGLFSYYRRFIPNFAKIAYPLFKLLQKDVEFVMGEAELAAFETLRKLMSEEPVLKAPDLTQPFIVTTDASDFALGAILSQGKIGSDQPCAFASRCLKGSEFRYPTYDKELLAVVYAKEQFRCYLFGRRFTICTDHEALKHFHTSKKPDLRFNRLKAALAGYDFDVIYRPGVKNANADALSRNPVLAEGEVDPDLPRLELYELADKQIREDPDEEAGAPPGRLFRARAVKVKDGDAAGKVRKPASSSESESERGEKKKKREDNALIFRQGEFLAVRNESNEYYICRALHNVYHGDKKIEIQWFTEKENEKRVYAPDYRGAVWFDCVLTSATMRRLGKDRYELCTGEHARISAILQQAIEFLAVAPAPAPPKASPRRKETSDSNESMRTVKSTDLSVSGASICPTQLRPYIQYVMPSDRETRSTQQTRGAISQKLYEPSSSSSGDESPPLPPSGRVANVIEPLQTFRFPRGQQSLGSSLPRGESPDEPPVDKDPPRLPAFKRKELAPTSASSAPAAKNVPAAVEGPQAVASWPWSGDLAKKKLRVNIEEKKVGGKGGMRIDLWEVNSSATSKSKNAISAQAGEPQLALGEKQLETSRDWHVASPSLLSEREALGERNPSASNGKIGSGNAKSNLIREKTVAESNKAPDVSPERKSKKSKAHDARMLSPPEPGGPFEDFAGVPRNYERRPQPSDENSSISSGNVCTHVYIRKKSCAEPHERLRRSDNIPSAPPGNCLFYSLMKLMKLKISASKLRRQLLGSPWLGSCGEPAEAEKILKSKTDYGTIDCVYIFAHEYKINVCVHYDLHERVQIFCHILVAGATEFIHLNLTGRHFTPYLRVNAPEAAAVPTRPSREASPSSDDERERPKSPVFGHTKRRKKKLSRTPEEPNANNGNKAGGEQNQLRTEAERTPEREAAAQIQTQTPSLAEPVDIDIWSNMPNASSNSPIKNMQPGGNSFNARATASERNSQVVPGLQPQCSSAALISNCNVSADSDAPADVGARTAAAVEAALKNNKMKRYVVATARPPREKPPWAIPEGQEPPPFVHLQAYNEHPFRFAENLVYLISADGFMSTEIQEALIERGYLNPIDLSSGEFKLGEINVTTCGDFKLIGVYIKEFFEDRPLRADLRKCLKVLRKVILKESIRSVAVIRDLAMLTLAEWAIFVDLFDIEFNGKAVVAILYKNSLPVPPVADRLKVIKEYHEAAMGAHRGMSKTYSKIANDFYWRNMRPDVKQFVARCAVCQSNKLIRVKTRLPLLISNTPSTPFAQIALDFYGPLEQTRHGNKYILSAQDMLTKYVILTPTKLANADEVARALTEKIICVFGPPAAIVTDQGKHFQNRVLEELARIFGITKFCTTAYHPQANGSIERMHHTLTEYLRKYVKNVNEWDKWTAICQHAYNCTEHESTRYSPHELLFGIKPRTPSSFPRTGDGVTYNEYIASMSNNLTALQTAAAMNLVQSKYRSKHYYDRKLNSKHFREGEIVFLIKEPKKGKFAKEYRGPFEIIAINRKTNNVTLQNDELTRTVHINKIERPSELAREAAASELSAAE